MTKKKTPAVQTVAEDNILGYVVIGDGRGGSTSVWPIYSETVARGAAFEAFELPKDEWHAFRHLFDPMPTLFTKDPDASN